MSLIGSKLGRKLWYREVSVKTSYFLFSLQHLDKERAGDGGLCRLLSMLKLLEVATGIPDPFNARLIAFSSSTLDNQIISLAKDRSRITGFWWNTKWWSNSCSCKRLWTTTMDWWWCQVEHKLVGGSPEGPNWDLGGGHRPQVRLLLTFSHLHVVVNIVTPTGQRVSHKRF